MTLAMLLSVALIQPTSAIAAVTIIYAPENVTVSLSEKTVVLVPPASTSPGAWTVEVEDPKIAKVNGLTLTLLSAGKTLINFVQSASGAYNAASRPSRLTVTPGTPTLGLFKDQSVALSQGTFTIVPPTSTSDAPWKLTSSDESIATISGNTLNLLDGGTVSITATQSPTLNWFGASASMSLSVSAPSPTVGTFSNIILSIDSVSKVELILPTSTSLGAWTLKSADPSVASIQGVVLTALKAGTTKISAKQAPRGGFRSVTLEMTVTILAVDPLIDAKNFKDQNIELSLGNTAQITLVPPASNSSGVWNFKTSDETVATVNGYVLTARRPGKVIVTAIQGPAQKFGASKPFTATISVQGRENLVAPLNVEKLAGDPDIAIKFPASLSGGSWTASSSDTSVVTISGNIAKIGNAGTAIISLNQVATESWTANSVSFSIRVLGITPTIGSFTPFEGGVGEKLTSIITPKSNSQGKWIFTSSDPSVADVIDNVIRGVAPGKVTISAYQLPSGKYGQSNTSQTFLVVKSAPTVGEFSNVQTVEGASRIKITPPASNSSGLWVYTSSDSTLVSVVGDLLQPLKAGVATIVATQAATESYAKVSRTFNVTTASKSLIAAKATATLSKRTLTISVKNSGLQPVTAMIDSKVVPVGKSTVTPGKKRVRVYVSGKLILNRVITVK